MLKTIKTTLIILTLSFVMIANAQAAEPEVKKAKPIFATLKAADITLTPKILRLLVH